eukprot:PhF_6_TR13180/c0_g1_i1/m.20790/K07151/STT3; dolichyl-diphosphooligosaccharide--protein glycosyltransferase
MKSKSAKTVKKEPQPVVDTPTPSSIPPLASALPSIHSTAPSPYAIPASKLLGFIPIPRFFKLLIVYAMWLAGMSYAVLSAYRIRLHAIKEFGTIIHEFDPWFNFRATQYLNKHGWHAFFHWFDYMVWYPLGRPVGTTIYPGLQITSVVIYRIRRMIGGKYAMSLNDVCCYVPCWFGSSAAVFVGLLTYECSGSMTASAVSALIMAIIPAHTMRSVGGGYDNECIAMTAMAATFYLWVRSIRAKTRVSSVVWGIVAGLSYGYMVAAWGGFVFVINMIAFHAACLVVVDWIQGKFDDTIYFAYTSFFIVGTFIATCVPPVSYMPFKSLEQISGFLVFLGLQVLYLSEIQRRKQRIPIWSLGGIKLRLMYIAGFVAVGAVVAALLVPTGFFGPLTSRVRSLFVEHMRTGNPLVDSVAEHQPADNQAFE